MSEPSRTFTARSPVDLVAAVPYVLGFHPSESVVLLTFGPGEAFHARVDLPREEDDQREVVTMLAEVVTRHGVGRVAVLLYTTDPWAAAAFHDVAVSEFVRRGVCVVDVLRVGDGRVHRAGDVDDPGTAYDLTTHPFTAEQVVDGVVVESSREALAQTLDCVDAEDAAAVAAAAQAVASAARERSALVSAVGRSEGLGDEARWVQRTTRRHVRTGTALRASDAGRMVALMADIRLRDVAWAEMSRAGATGQVQLWRDLVRRCPPDLLPGPSCLLAFAAWLAGQGALAWCALDRCTEVDPEYSMADCIAQLLAGAVPPSVWTPIPEAELPAFWPPDLEAS
ncbi:MAG TPA: DUF4192 domain-containing protein [Marmoricola sp.]|nr:DUF4192 domain-containing protein [Marmoricola sp.]